MTIIKRPRLPIHSFTQKPLLYHYFKPPFICDHNKFDLDTVYRGVPVDRMARRTHYSLVDKKDNIFNRMAKETKNRT